MIFLETGDSEDEIRDKYLNLFEGSVRRKRHLYIQILFVLIPLILLLRFYFYDICHLFGFKTN